MQIKKEDYDTLESEESIIDSLLQGSYFRQYFPEIADKMLEIKKDVYTQIQDAELID